MGETFHRSAGKRRASHQSTEHELEDQVNEWANMTGFLCALGGVCLQRRSPRPTVNAAPTSSNSGAIDRKSNVISFELIKLRLVTIHLFDLFV